MPRGGKRSTNKIKTLTCEHCGRRFSFTAVGRTPRTCSKECKQQLELNERGKPFLCEICGKPFTAIGNNRKYCSYACAGEARCSETHYRTLHNKTCSVCGQVFQTINLKQVACSTECGRKQAAITRTKVYTCLYCERSYIDKHSNGSRKTYCSHECSILARFGSVQERKERNALRLEEMRAARMRKVACEYCGTPFETVYATKRFCSEVCLNAMRLEKGRAEWIERYQPRTFTCKMCGKLVTTVCGDKRSAYCSDSCMTSHLRSKYNERRAELMKKAFRTSVSFKDIYQRDGGTCKICGLPVAYDKTPKEVWAATIDHIVPLSQGGVHHPDNCQLAHRLCNSLKLQGMADFHVDWDKMLLADPVRWGTYLESYEAYMSEHGSTLHNTL